MLKCKISGLCLKVYSKDYQDKEGKKKTMSIADIYVSPDLVHVSRVDSRLVGEGMQITDLPVKVYNGQYGLSVVFDDDDL